MTDVTKVGVPNPQPVNRPTSPPKPSTSDGADKSGGSDAASASFRLPDALSGGQAGSANAADALKAVLASLNARFGDLDGNPPANGGALEDLLSEIKVAAPVLDRILAARKDELRASDDADGLAALDSELAQAEASITDARDRLQALAADLADDGPADDPALAGALGAILGEGREIPTFTAEEIREGRQEFIALVLDDIADALGRHRGAGASAASFTLSSLGGSDLTA